MRNRLGWLLICAALFVTPCWANEIDYFCLFTTATVAQGNAAVGRFWNATALTWDLSRTFPGIKVTTAQAIVNGVSTLTGFWIRVSMIGADSLLDAETSLRHEV